MPDRECAARVVLLAEQTSTIGCRLMRLHRLPVRRPEWRVDDRVFDPFGRHGAILGGSDAEAQPRKAPGLRPPS